MSKKNWTDIFKTDLLALIKTDKETGDELTIDEKNRKVGDMFFKGAWKEDGAAKWAFFEGKEAKNAENQEEQQDIEKLKVREVEPHKEPIQKSKKIKPDEVVSITAIGRNLTSRYETNTLEPPPPGKKAITWKEGQKIRVFFSEDNQSYQRVLSTILNRSTEVDVIGYASNGMEAVEEIEKLQTPPHVILMDIAMPRLDGIQATKKLLESNPALKIVILTAFGDKMNVVNAFRAGAIGYLRKDSGMAVILDSIKQVARGYPPPLQDDIAAFLVEGAEEAQSEKEFSDELQVV
ncbi:MAG: response regulator transcription factor, partial [Candidatus Eremiobacterota bacterium]